MTERGSWQVPADWWKDAFDEFYLLTDARSVDDPEVTSTEVDALCRLIGPWKGGRVLDLCGGHGRHTRELASRGFDDICLLDYSWPLLLLAADGSPGGMTVVRGDARRLPFRAANFDLILLLGNSFGYFTDEGEKRRILEEVTRVLRPGGRFFLDILDPDYIRETFKPRSEHRCPNGMVVVRERSMEGREVRARETLLGEDQDPLRVIHYSFRLYDASMLKGTMLESGLSRVTVHRGFSGLDRLEDCGFMENRQLVLAVK